MFAMSQQDEKKDSVRHSGMECVGGMYPILHEMLKEKKVKGESFFYPHVEHVLFESVLVPNPAVPKGSKPTVVAKDFSYLSEVRRLLEADKTREIIVDGLEFGAFGAVQSIRKELTGGNCRLKSTMIRQIRPITAPQNDRYEELCGCVLITGGAGGLGKLYREYLLHYYPECTVAIMSRSIDPSDLSCARLTPFQGDVTKKEDVERVVAAIPDLVGVVHAAGVGYGGPFAMTNEDDAKTLFARHRAGAIKYDGTRHLFETTKDLELRFLMLASSISAACGDFNLTHYAAANSCMDDFALKQRAAGHVNVISTQWGALGIVGPVGGMAGDNTRKLMDMRGHGVVTEEQMVDFLETCIHQASDLPPVVMLSPLNIDKCTAQRPELADNTSLFCAPTFNVYVDVCKARAIEDLNPPWSWDNIPASEEYKSRR